MNNESPRKQVAQPAEEEIKKHGDQLQEQVDTAAGKPGRESSSTKPESDSD